MGVKLRAAPKFYLANKGEPAVGWKIYTYEPGTLVEKATFTDNARTAENTNPVILDEYGEADIWWSGSYKVIVKDENDVTIYTVDNYGAGEDIAVSGSYNLVANGSFELDDDGNNLPDDWEITEYDATSTVVIDTGDPNHGTNCLKFVSTGLGGGYAESALIEVTGSQDLFVGFNVKSSVVDVRNRIEMKWYDKDQVLLATSSVWDESAANPTSWTDKKFVSTSHASAKYAKMVAYGCHNSDATAGETRFDNMRVTAITGTMMLQDSDAVDITGGDITGLTNIATTHLFTTPPVTGGTTTAYTATLNETAYVTNRVYTAQINADCGASPTINFDGLGDKAIKNVWGSALASGALQAGQVVNFTYDGTDMIIPVDLAGFANGDSGAPPIQEAAFAAGAVAADYADTAYAAIGSLVIAISTTGGATITAGSTYAGSGLKALGMHAFNISTFPTGGESINFDTASAVLTGTWRALSTSSYLPTTNYYAANLFLRIS